MLDWLGAFYATCATDATQPAIQSAKQSQKTPQQIGDFSEVYCGFFVKPQNNTENII